MGLGWIVDRKPIKGNEKQFLKLQKALDKALMQNNDDADNIEKEFYKISISPSIILEKFNPKEIDTIFSGKCIFFSSVIEDELLKEEAGAQHNALQSLDYANRLEIEISSINKDNLDEDELDDYEYIIKGIKWLRFWGRNGHGFTPCY
jgi:hypothetical protein